MTHDIAREIEKDCWGEDAHDIGGSAVDAVVIRPIWGHFELVPCGLFGFTERWHYNHRLSMTEQEQYDSNKETDPSFCRERHIPPAIKITFE